MINPKVMSDEEFDPSKLDEGIRQVVCYLRSKMFRTKASCQGKTNNEDHCFEYPTVIIHKGYKGISLYQERLRLVRELRAGGYSGFMTSVKHLEGKRPEDPKAKTDKRRWICLEFFDITCAKGNND